MRGKEKEKRRPMINDQNDQRQSTHESKAIKPQNENVLGHRLCTRKETENETKLDLTEIEIERENS